MHLIIVIFFLKYIKFLKHFLSKATKKFYTYLYLMSFKYIGLKKTIDIFIKLHANNWKMVIEAFFLLE